MQGGNTSYGSDIDEKFLHWEISPRLSPPNSQRWYPVIGDWSAKEKEETWNVNKNSEMLKIRVNIHMEHLRCKYHFPPLLRLYDDFEEKFVEFNWIFEILMFWVLNSQFHGKQYKFTTLSSAPTEKVWMRYVLFPQNMQQWGEISRFHKIFSIQFLQRNIGPGK